MPEWHSCGSPVRIMYYVDVSYVIVRGLVTKVLQLGVTTCHTVARVPWQTLQSLVQNKRVLCRPIILTNGVPHQ